MDALTIMKRLGQGRTLEEWGDAIKSVAAEVSETGKSGSVTLKVEIKPLGGQGGLEVGLKETLSRTPPKTGERGALLFTYEEDLHTADPRQPTLPQMTVVGNTVVNRQDGEVVRDFDDEALPDVKEAGY